MAQVTRSCFRTSVLGTSRSTTEIWSSRQGAKLAKNAHCLGVFFFAPLRLCVSL